MQDKNQQPQDKPLTTKRVQISNLHRDVLLIPVEAGGNDQDGKMFRLGDKVDTDDQVPAGRVRDERYQPNPVVVVTPQQWSQFGAWARGVIDEFVTMGRLNRQELA